MRTPISRILIFFVLAFFSAPQVNASFQNAMKSYKAGEFEEAKEAFEIMAEIGDASSLYNLGVMSIRGEAIAKDIVRGYVLIRIANESTTDKAFTKTMNLVFAQLNDTQKEAAAVLYTELNSLYGKDSIEENISPKLLDDEDCPPEVLPIERPPPVYPRRELVKGRMGIVNLEYIISPEGYAREIFVTSSTSEEFSKNALDAATKFLYEKPVDGRPFSRRILISFQIKRNKGTKFKYRSFMKEIDEQKSKAEQGDIVSQYFYARGLNNYRIFKDYLPDKDFQYRTANEWYMKSAKGGLSYAQYEIGRNMVEGRGCEVDRKSGFKWIKAAAVGGFSPAQNYLATSELSNIAEAGETNRSLMAWLKNSSRDEYLGHAAKALLAWQLVSSAEKQLLDPDTALELLQKKSDIYRDNLRIFETRAAAYAVKGDFKQAIKWQKKGQKEAAKNGWEIPKVDERLKLYEQGQVYIGSYY